MSSHAKRAGKKGTCKHWECTVGTRCCCLRLRRGDDNNGAGKCGDYDVRTVRRCNKGGGDDEDNGIDNENDDGDGNVLIMRTVMVTMSADENKNGMVVIMMMDMMMI